MTSGARTFQEMSVQTVEAYMRILVKLSKEQHKPATEEQALAILQELLEGNFQAAFEAGLRAGVEVGYEMRGPVDALLVSDN